MPKPYSQDLRDRVIDAVERGELSLAAQRRGATRSANRQRSSGLRGLNGMARESLSDMAATGLPSWRRTVIFWKLRAPRSRTSRFRRFAIAFCRSEPSKPTLR